MSTPKLVTLDWETYYAPDYTLSKMPAEEYIRDPRFEIIGVGIKMGDKPAVWISEPMDQLYDRVRRSKWDDKVLLGHNMSEFDSLILTHHFGVRPRNYLCTLAMARATHGGKMSKALGSLAKHYGLPAKGDEVVRAIGKRRADFSPEELRAYGEYCKTDCEITYQLYNVLRKLMPAQEQRFVHLFTKMFAEPKLELDMKVLTEYRDELVAKKIALLIDAGLTQKELRSDPVFAEALEKLGVVPPRKISKTTGKEAYAFAKTDEAMVALLEHDNPDVQTLAAARIGVKSTIEESRVERFIGIGSRGLLPVPLVYGKTHTHRAAGGGKINLQNLGRNSPLRKAIKAPPGKIIVVADSSNIELRVAHCLAGQMDTVEKLRQGLDLYCEFATTLYGYPVNKKEHPKERQHGKVAMLQLQYQSGAGSFQNAARIMGGLKLDMQTCQNTVDIFRSKFDMVKAFWKKCQNALLDMDAGNITDIDVWGHCTTSKDCILLPNGTKLQYFNLRQEPDEKFGTQWVYDDKEKRMMKRTYGGSITENLCQALARIVVFDQMLEVEKKYGRYEDVGCGVALTVHDEIVAVVDEDKGEECLAFTLDVMHESPKWWPELPVAAEGGVAMRYGDAK
jgi:DNA polymerase bacteriophage-type